MTKVNPSQRVPVNSPEALVVIRKEDGAVVVGWSLLCIAGEVLVCVLPPRTSSEYCLCLLNWMNLFQQRCVFIVHQIHKCILKVAPDYLLSKFSSNSSFGYSSTRGCDNLHLFRPKTDFGKNTLQFKGAQLYNSLPSHIRVLQNLSAFRRACVAYFS